MKKIIAVFDGHAYSQSARNYALDLAKQIPAYLVGVFMDDPTNTDHKRYAILSKEEKPTGKPGLPGATDAVTRGAAVKNFAELCEKEQLEFNIHHDHNIALLELKHESIYADLLIIDSKETFTHYPEELPTRFIRDLLSDVQCPVLMVPQKYKPIREITLLYDGEPSSVHAIKMFSYLFPHLKDLETEVITVHPENRSLHLPDNKLMNEFMKRHYPKAKYVVMKGIAEEEIVKHLKQRTGNSLVVLGAYRRGAVSRWFRESMADILMKEVKFPLFIAHNK